MKRKPITKSRTKAVALAAVMVVLPCPAAVADESPKLPENAAEHVAGPAYLKAPEPELNPWAAKGIPSQHSFGALYTRKHYPGEKWHEISRTDEYADVVVRFGDVPLEIVFGRVSSYHPEVLVTGKVMNSFPELIERRGDGTKRRPDKVNRHARARVIESSDQGALVHYRYLPIHTPREELSLLNPPDQRTFVDEYFLFRPDRSGLRAIRPGAERMEEWHDPSRIQVTGFRIGGDGTISTFPATDADHKAMLEAMGFQGAPKRDLSPAPLLKRPPNTPAPMLSWSFDTGHGRMATESVSGDDCPIEGHAAIWRRGVSGSALLFDGYTSAIEYPAKDRLQGDQVTLSAYLAIAAYPWNVCPIVQQGDVLAQGAGVALGIDPHGRPLLAIRSAEETIMVHADDEKFRIPRFQWTHLSGIIDRKAGEARLYLDGKQVASAVLTEKEIQWATDQPVKIGRGPALDAVWPVGRMHGAYPYGFEGLIDEVEIHHQPVMPDPAALGSLRNERPDMDRRMLPSGHPSWKNFGARYTHLRYHESWDSMFRFSGHPDVVVTFDKIPVRYVFWHGVNYVPMMVNEKGQWYSNEFNETWWNGGFEPMSDKRMVYGRVDIVEQSPARVVVRWRYPLSDVGYGIYAEGWADDSGWGEWSDWYFTIYPDGSCVKRMRSWMSLAHGREWHESMIILGPEQQPETVIDSRPTLTLGTLDGTIRKYNWIKDPPADVDFTDVSLHIINLKADYDPYSICAPVTRGNVYKKRGDNPYSVFPAWNHWPVGQFPSTGRYARYPDRSAHCSATHLYWDPSVAFQENGSFEEKLLLEGLSKMPEDRLLEMSRSYLTPPSAKAISKQTAVAWSDATRSYVITRESGSVNKMEIEVDASGGRPTVNPVLVVENWGSDQTADLRLNGSTIPATMDVRQGVVARPNGVNALVVWIETTLRQSTRIGISR